MGVLNRCNRFGRLFFAWLAFLTTGSVAFAQVNTTTMLSATPSSIVVGESTALKATISPPAASGTVTFKNGTATLGTASIKSGAATLNQSFTSSGNRNITAVYGGSSQYRKSTSSVVVLAVKSATTTKLTSSINPAALGQNTALIANITPAAATGIVTFKDGTATLGTASISSGVAKLTAGFSTAGVHNLTAIYGGSGNYAVSTSAALAQNINKAATEVVLTSSVNPSNTAQTTVLKASIIPVAATGIVTFKNGSTILGTAEVANGAATFSTTITTGGKNSLTAFYGGDASNASATSVAFIQTVNFLPATSTSLTSSVNPSTNSGATVLTATVSPATASGSVTYKDGSTELGSVTLVSGVAKLNHVFATAGSHNVTASYNGSSNNAASTSSVLQQIVNERATLPLPLNSPIPVVEFEYDAQGNLTKATQAPGNFGFVTQKKYDAHSRPVKITDAKNGVVQIGYDALDRTIQVIDPRNLVTQSPRNAMGEVTQLLSPDTGRTSVSYDAKGNILTRTDNRGVVSTFAYDALSRPTSLIYTLPGEPEMGFSFVYDQVGDGFAYGIGRLTSTTQPYGSTQYAYDARGRLVSDVQRINATPGANSALITTKVEYRYDLGGNVIRIAYPSGRVVNFTMTGGSVSAISLSKDASTTPVEVVNKIRFGPLGGALGWRWLSATGPVEHNRVFDTVGRLIRYQLGGFVRDVEYDAADRITGYTHYDSATGTITPASSGLNQTFSYDALDRLTKATTAQATWSYAYDPNGNRTSVTINNGTPSAYRTSQTSNQLQSISAPPIQLNSDAIGNITTDGNFALKYDLRGRMASLSQGGIVTTYAYNARGQRVRKTSGSAANTIIFVYDFNGQLLGEYDGQGKAIREYVWLGETPMAVFTPDPAQGANAGTADPLVFYIHADHINTPRVVMDTNNAVRWRWMAEPFGTTAADESPSGLPPFTFNLRFPGQYYDEESGIHQNWHRDYIPGIGRYAQSDPIGLAGGVNTFGYANVNPIKYIDPTGLFVPLVIPGVCAAGGCEAVGAALTFGAVWWANNNAYVKPPSNAYDPDGPKAPGKPSEADGFKSPKGGDNWVPNPNPGKGGSSWGWQDAKGDVWCPTGQGGNAHGGPHWDVQTPGGDYRNVKPRR